MPRFVKQRDYYSCGPVAIANAIKALGGRINYSKTHKVLTVACQTGLEGTSEEGFERALKKFLPIYVSGDLTIRFCQHPTIQEVENHVALGKGVVILATDACLQYRPELKSSLKETPGHCSVLTSVKKGLFTFANEGGNTIFVCSRTTTQKEIGRCRAWFIRRNP